MLCPTHTPGRALSCVKSWPRHARPGPAAKLTLQHHRPQQQLAQCSMCGPDRCCHMVQSALCQPCNAPALPAVHTMCTPTSQPCRQVRPPRFVGLHASTNNVCQIGRCSCQAASTSEASTLGHGFSITCDFSWTPPFLIVRRQPFPKCAQHCVVGRSPESRTACMQTPQEPDDT